MNLFSKLVMKGVMLIKYNEGASIPEFHQLGNDYEWEEGVHGGMPDYFSERRKQGYISRDPLSDAEGRFLRQFWKTDAPEWKKVAANLERDVLSLILDEDRTVVSEALNHLISVRPYGKFTEAKHLLETLSPGLIVFYNQKVVSDKPIAEHYALGGNLFRVDTNDGKRELIVDGVKLAEKLREGTYSRAQLYELITNDETLLIWHSVDEVVEKVRRITVPPRPLFYMPELEEL